MNLIIFLIAVSLILIVYMLIRVRRLILSTSTKEHEEEAVEPVDITRKSQQVNGALMLGFLIVGIIAVIWSAAAASKDFLPPAVSVHGVTVDNITNITLIITGLVFFITQIALFYFSFRYRKRKNTTAFYFPINYRIEIIWTVIPAIAFTALFILGSKATQEIYEAPSDDAVTIEIVGQQFSWMTRYPGEDGKLGDFDFRLIDAGNPLGLNLADEAVFDDFMPMQIVVPKNKTVELKIRSRDVIHSVFLPHFRVKMDAVPGMPTRFKFIPTMTTEEMRQNLGNPDFNYEMACAELCGRSHFAMRLILRVVEEEEFNEWYASQEPWLAKNPAYLRDAPEELRTKAYQLITKYDSIPELSQIFVQP